MKVWVLIHQYAADGEAGYVAGVYSTEAAADAAHLTGVREIIEAGNVPYYNPETDEERVDWDEDYVVEEHELRESANA